MKRWPAIDRRSSCEPDFPSASYNLANALLAQGQAGASVEQFQKALEISPQSVEAQNNLGIALAAKGDAPGAMAAFRAALAIDDRSVHAHRNLGNLLIDTGARAEGVAHLERAIALAPNEPEAIYDIGTVLLEDQNFAGGGGAIRGGAEDQARLARGAQQSRHRARLTGTDGGGLDAFRTRAAAPAGLCRRARESGSGPSCTEEVTDLRSRNSCELRRDARLRLTKNRERTLSDPPL